MLVCCYILLLLDLSSGVLQTFRYCSYNILKYWNLCFSPKISVNLCVDINLSSLLTWYNTDMNFDYFVLLTVPDFFWHQKHYSVLLWNNPEFTENHCTSHYLLDRCPARFRLEYLLLLRHVFPLAYFVHTFPFTSACLPNLIKQ